MDPRRLPVEEWAEIHAAYSNPRRIELMLTLYPNKELSFKRLKEKLKLGSATLDYHLTLLGKYGLVENRLERRSDTISQYRLSEKGKKILKTSVRLLKE